MGVCQDKKKRLLIISNNVLSQTNNNGKTILSYIDGLDKNKVRQLYFNNEQPTIEGYEYFRITNRDVFRAKFYNKPSGEKIDCILCPAKKEDNNTKKIQQGLKLPRNVITCSIRNWLWGNSWISSDLLDWLDTFKPTTIFFLGGDTLFAYDICMFIWKRYKCRLALYITDDYIMPRKKEKCLNKIYRNKVKNKMQKCLKEADIFFTVSEPMRVAYKKTFNRDSTIIVNMSPLLKREEYQEKHENVHLIYTGSLYYGRENVIGLVSKAIRYYNLNNKQKIYLDIYTNRIPDMNKANKLKLNKYVRYKGHLDSEGLIKKLNCADILLFVESFEEKYVEKTKFSLSTKVTEYLSIGKPILAIGPKNIGSMKYLEDVAMCVNSSKDIYEKLVALSTSCKMQSYFAYEAEKKYLNNLNKLYLQKKFEDRLFGNIGELQ